MADLFFDGFSESNVLLVDFFNIEGLAEKYARS